MKKQFTRHTRVSQLKRTGGDLYMKLLAALRAFAQPDAAPHIGVFAGSLLPYASWAQPKVPH